MNIKDIDNTYVANTYARFPLLIKEGRGSIVKDENGKEYIDLTSGIGVNTFGIADDLWIEAIEAQIRKVQHMSNLYYTEPSALLAKELCERTGMKKVFFSNSGAESNECAIKIARKYAADTKGNDCYTIITLKNSFHGRTLTTLAATGQNVFHEHFQPLTPGFVHAEPNDLNSVEKLIKEHQCAGILIEVVQGEGGVIPLDKDYVKGLAKLAKENDLVLMCDEVQSGNGRSGKYFAYMHYDIKPDVVSTAKGLAGGLPFGATLFGEKVKDTLGPGLHATTFGGNPVAAAAALSIVKRIDDDLLSEVEKKSKFIKESLINTPGVKDITGLGLMLGISCEGDSTKILNKLMEQGVLVLKAKDKIRLLPPLNIPDDILKTAVEKITKAISG